jgi:hypothetical protein
MNYTEIGLNYELLITGTYACLRTTACGLVEYLTLIGAECQIFDWRVEDVARGLPLCVAELLSLRRR